MTERVVLCFGDSNTWGASPTDISRFAFSTRWPGQLAAILGPTWRVVEEGLPNRTTCFHDPAIPLRNGEEVFPMVLETHSPVDTVVIMLGTNDAKDRVNGNPNLAVDGLRRIAEHAVRCGTRPLIIAPAPMIPPIKYSEFDGPFAETYGRELAAGLRQMTLTSQIDFLEAARFVSVSPEDGVHLDAAAHAVLALEVARRIIPRVLQS